MIRSIRIAGWSDSARRCTMPSPFPGMDPFLENPAIFPDLHDSLIIYLREAINAQLQEPYFATTGERTWIAASQRYIEPDVNLLRGTPTTNGGAVQGTSAAVGVVAVAQAVQT